MGQAHCAHVYFTAYMLRIRHKCMKEMTHCIQRTLCVVCIPVCIGLMTQGSFHRSSERLARSGGRSRLKHAWGFMQVSCLTLQLCVSYKFLSPTGATVLVKGFWMQTLGFLSLHLSLVQFLQTSLSTCPDGTKHTWMARNALRFCCKAKLSMLSVHSFL